MDDIVVLNTIEGALPSDLKGKGMQHVRWSCATTLDREQSLAVASAKLVVITCHPKDHEVFAAGVASIVNDEQTILLHPPGVGGALRVACILAKFGRRIPVLETSKSLYPDPWAEGRAYVRWQDELLLAGLPAEAASRWYERLRLVWPGLRLARSISQTMLSQAGCLLRAGTTVLNASWAEEYPDRLTLPHDGWTEGVARLVARLDSERLAIANAAGAECQPLLEWFGTEDDDVHLREAVKQCPLIDKDMLVDVSEQAVYEAIGLGIVPMAELGRCLGVETPFMDSLIGSASQFFNINYLGLGSNASKMGLTPKTLSEFWSMPTRWQTV